MPFKEFTHVIQIQDLTPRDLLNVLQKIPEDYLDQGLHLSVPGKEYPTTIELTMAIDDGEDSRPAWRAGNPDYLLFMDIR